MPDVPHLRSLKKAGHCLVMAVPIDERETRLDGVDGLHETFELSFSLHLLLRFWLLRRLDWTAFARLVSLKVVQCLGDLSGFSAFKPMSSEKGQVYKSQEEARTL